MGVPGGSTVGIAGVFVSFGVGVGSRVEVRTAVGVIFTAFAVAVPADIGPGGVATFSVRERAHAANKTIPKKETLANRAMGMGT